MRVITWNCNKKSADKVGPLLHALEPDIAILPESARHLEAGLKPFGATDAVWTGDDERAGLGVYAFNSAYQLRALGDVPPLADPNESQRARTERLRRWTLPIDVTGAHDFFLLAVWAHNKWVYRPVNAAIREFSDRLDGPSIVAGDFNHGSAWDGDSMRDKDHQKTVKLLGDHGLVSAYHQARGVAEHRDRSATDDPTFWMNYDRDQPHHIDYVYAPSDWISDDPASVTIGAWNQVADPGNRISDHAPVCADLTVG